MERVSVCRRCDRRIPSAFDGHCPRCLALFALDDIPEAETAVVPERLGKYVLEKRLGSGGMGDVWKARDTDLNRWVALKFLKDQDPKERARFAREARMAAQLAHPNIAAVHEIGECSERRYIAMTCV